MIDLTHLTTGVLAGLLIRAIWNTGSFILLFTRDPEHHRIYRHNREEHKKHFSKCSDGACADGVGVQEAIV
jgi:hypothetical protein